MRLCLDKTQSAGSTHNELKENGAKVVVKKTGVLEHNKSCIIDNNRVLMGSWNFSGSAQKQDNSIVNISSCDDIIKNLTEAFDRIYQRDK